MKPPRVEFRNDHLILKLEGVRSVEAARRAIVIPYSTIENAEVKTPHWPGVMDGWKYGAHLPGLVARGTFVAWSGRRRFLDIDRKTKQALTLRLEGHAEFDEVEVDVPDAGEALGEIAKHRQIAPGLPPVYE